MLGAFIIRNGETVPASEGNFALDDLSLTHGLGCYETLKVRSGLLYFPEFHEERLLGSLGILGIQHSIAPGQVTAALSRLVEANGLSECNVKVIAVDRQGRAADWYAMALPPIIPPREAAAGLPCLVVEGQRQFPRAKSLSLLLSTIAFRRASAAGCWDALLLNARGCLTEGTRTNLFYCDGHAPAGFEGPLYTPPSADVLEGVTRRTLIEALDGAGIRTEERSLPESEAQSGRYSMMMTSTSSNVIPVSALAGRDGKLRELPVPPFVDRIRNVYGGFLERYASARGEPA